MKVVVIEIREQFAVKEADLKNSIRFIIMIVALVVSLPALAQEKCNAIPWGEKLSVMEQVTFAREAEGVRYYTVNKVEACGINKIEDTRVTYGFRDNRLYATITEIAKARSLGRVVGLLIDDYGLPETRSEAGWDIYRWETDTLKIKLKSQYSTDRIKIGMYYKPLEAK